MWTKIAASACATVLLSGCGSPGDSRSATDDVPAATVTTSSDPAATASVTSPSSTSPGPSATASSGVVITIASSQFGPVLFDGSGQAIYLFDADKTSEPTCYGECAAAWPPVLTTGRPVVRGGVTAELLGVTTRRDGARQVTYAGKPLYFYAHEGKNVVLCHNIREFGGLWLAVTTTGAPAPT